MQFSVNGRRCFAVIVLTLTSPALARASCGTITCPYDTFSAERREKGDIRIGYDFLYVPQNQPRTGTNKASVGEIPGHHDEVYTYSRTHRLTGTWGMTDRLSLDLALPFVSRSHQHVHHHHGEELVDTWSFSDVGDFVAQARYAFYRPEKTSRPTVSAILGGKFPTGQTEEHNEDGDHAETGITPGSGSYDLIVGASSLQRFSVPMLGGTHGELPFFTSLYYKINGKGVDDYLIGNQLTMNVGATYPLLRWLGFMTQLNLNVAQEDGAGLTHEEVEKTGGEFLYISPGLSFDIGHGFSAQTLIQLPLYQHVNEIQLTSDWNLVSSLAYRFKL